MAAAATPPPEDAAAAVPVQQQGMGSLFDNYDPTGALGGLFAPGYIKGYAPSEQAVAAWSAAHHPVTYANVDQSRMPQAWVSPDASKKTMADGVYGAGVPQTQVYGDPRGPVDPEALRVLAQGGTYNWDARRAAIAQQLAANQQAQSAYDQQQANRNPWGLYYGSP